MQFADLKFNATKECSGDRQTDDFMMRSNLMVEKRSAKLELNKWVALLIGLLTVISTTIAAYDRVVFKMYDERQTRSEQRLEKHEIAIHSIELNISAQTQMLSNIADDIADIKKGLK